MNLEIHAETLPVDRELRALVDRRVASALGRFADRLGRVVVVLNDLNGPKGGVDSRCRIDAEVRPLGRLVVEDRAENPYAALARAAHRIRSRVARALGRRRHG